MITKHTFDESPIDKYQLKRATKLQKRNGYMLFGWRQREKCHYPCTFGIAHTYYIIHGCCQIKAEKTDQMITLNAGEYAYLPRGNYSFWFESENTEYVTLIDELPQEFVDSYNIENIDVD